MNLTEREKYLLKRAVLRFANFALAKRDMKLLEEIEVLENKVRTTYK
mgnify:FL=1